MELRLSNMCCLTKISAWWFPHVLFMTAYFIYPSFFWVGCIKGAGLAKFCWQEEIWMIQGLIYMREVLPKMILNQVIALSGHWRYSSILWYLMVFISLCIGESNEMFFWFRKKVQPDKWLIPTLISWNLQPQMLRILLVKFRNLLLVPELLIRQG